jgi:hypothetical protein
MAVITIAPNEDVAGLAAHAGSVDFYYAGGNLICDDITQDALDAAVGSFDFTASTNTSRIASIKAKAGAVIYSRIPAWKQSNLLARKSELQDILLSGASLSVQEQAEWDWMITEWAWAKSVRAVSDQAELDGTALDDVVWPV